MLADNRKGNYTFIRGIGPFSAAVTAHPGFAIVHARFLPLIALNDGYKRVDRHLQEVQRPLEALCGMELRIPQVLSREAFDEFNRPYIERLKAWGLDVAGANPVTRTNVAFETNPVAGRCWPASTIRCLQPSEARPSYYPVRRKLPHAKAAFRSWRVVILQRRGCARSSIVSCRYSALICPR